LGQIITDLELDADAPLKKTCGACVRCIDDCPTGAIVAPYVVDNTRCISYLTIENRGAIPRELRPLMQDWVFGCDICQDVCPVNRKADPPVTPILLASTVARDDSASAMGLLELVELLEMPEPEFKSRFQGTSVMRAKHSGMQRNAAVALGNLGEAQAVPALARALFDGSALLRGHVAWALGRIGTPKALEALTEASRLESDEGVLEEIRTALVEGFPL
jgi:epoxyqueuosine reductase